MSDDGTAIDDMDRALALPKVTFESSFASGDLCTPRLPWGDVDVRSFMGRAAVCRVGEVRVRYIGLDDLIAMRRSVGREKDIRRARELEQLRAG